jgi:hypothetical protein
LENTLRKWYATVLWLMNSREPISAFDRPSRARRAICTSDCNICREQDDLKTGSELLDAPIPGGYIVEDARFLVEHAPLQESSAGTVIVEALTERAPHFHLWLVPKKNEGELRGADYLSQRPPLTASYSAADEMSRTIRTEFERA